MAGPLKTHVMIWAWSREHRPGLGNCSDPSEKSDDADQKRGRHVPETGNVWPSRTQLRAGFGVTDNTCERLAILSQLLSIENTILRSSAVAELFAWKDVAR